MLRARLRRLPWPLAVLLLACTADTAPTASTAPADLAAARAQPAGSCRNVEFEGQAALGFVVLPNGVAGLGGTWTPTVLGGIAGETASVLVGEEISGGEGQGARHWTLVHSFRTLDGDWFVTEDRAVCAPAGRDPTTCRVNDVMTIVGGTGIFADATGKLRNHGTIDFVNGTLEISMRGRVCGEGL